MSRLFWINEKLYVSSHVEFSGEELHHLRAMRITPGDVINIANGSGDFYKAQIIEMTRAQAVLKIIKEEKLPKRPRPKINLGQAIPRYSKTEFILQKATELGVDIIYPLQSERSFLPQNKSLSQNRWQRWERIIKEAAKQSGRVDLPSLIFPQTMDSFLKNGPEADLKICFWEGSDPGKNLKDLLRSLKRPDSISMLVGPEGSFSQKEIENIRASGYHLLFCGPRIMRVETAALTCMAICRYEWGDL
ncbi:MAG: RsmE family RNA methyltransferase [bacterium]